MKLSRAFTLALKQICLVLIGLAIGLAIHHPIFEQPETVKAEWRKESIRRGEEICTFFNRRPINENAYKILFIGNSLTCHPMRGGVWSSIHGMAATAHEKDYLHIFVEHLRKKMPDRSIEVFLETGAGVGQAIDRIEGGEHEKREYDLVVVQRGENDKVFDDEFKRQYRELVNIIPAKHGRLVLSDWYYHKRVAFQEKVAREANAEFIDISNIALNPENSGYAGPYNHRGVASHPNDLGMTRIAERLAHGFDRLPRSELGQKRLSPSPE